MRNSVSQHFASPTRSSSLKVSPPANLNEKLAKMYSAIEDLREDLSQEVSANESLEKLSKKVISS